jgi:hypothetical protein
MKLLLENWREYLVESEKAQDYGHLYVFEEDTVRQTSFYDALNLLSENENAIETFLENWERSVNYHIEQLDEAAMADMASNPILYLSKQAFLLIDRLKGQLAKHASKILGVVDKVHGLLTRFQGKYPTLYKIGYVAIKVIIAMMVVYLISSIFGAGEAHAGDVVSREIQGSEIVDRVVASAEQLRTIGEAAKQVEGIQDVGQELLNIANNPQDVHGGVGSDISLKAQKIIKHGLEQLSQNEQATAVADAAGQAAKNLPTETVTVTQTTISDTEMLAQQKEMARAIKAAGLSKE